MSFTARACVVVASLTALVGGAQLACGALSLGRAFADDLHNVTYRARVDGVARGALIIYKINDTATQSADPTMLPGQVFEANAVLSDPQQAGMTVSIKWPYSANLHCEILVDDATVAQADQYIAPRLVPARDDPNYGVLFCGAPIDEASASPLGPNPAPVTPSPGQNPPAT
jgi:hypothetical protein